MTIVEPLPPMHAGQISLDLAHLRISPGRNSIGRWLGHPFESGGSRATCARRTGSLASQSLLRVRTECNNTVDERIGK